jgi:hypothetical protein
VPPAEPVFLGSRRARPLTLAALAFLFAILLQMSWLRWGHVRVDTGGALDRAARIAQGAVLYRDVLSPYGPLPDYAVAAAFRVFGIRLGVVYAIGLALLVAESFLLWRVAAMFLTQLECAVGLAAFWVLFAFAPGFFGWVLPNVFASTFAAVAATATLALAIAACAEPRPGRFVAGSLAAAAAGLSKVEFGLAAVATLVAAVWLAPGDRRRLLVAALLPGLVATLAVTLVFVLLVPWRELLFDNLYRVRSLGQTVARLREGAPALVPLVREILLRYGLELPLRAALFAVGLGFVAGGGVGRHVGVVLSTASLLIPLLPRYPELQDFTLLADSVGFAWSPMVWVVAFVVSIRQAGRGDPAATAITLAAVWSVCLSLRWNLSLAWTSYYGFLAPFLLLLLVRSVTSRLNTRRAPLAVACVIAVPLAAAAITRWNHFAQQYRFALSYPRGTILTLPLYGQPLETVIDYVRTHTALDDYVAVLPEERIINFLAERRHPTRDPGIGPGWLATPADEERFIREIEERRTALVVISNRVFPEFGVGRLGSYNPSIEAYIRRNWDRVLATDGDGYVIYARRS